MFHLYVGQMLYFYIRLIFSDFEMKCCCNTHRSVEDLVFQVEGGGIWWREVFQVGGGGWERWFLAANWGQSRPQRPHPCLYRANIFSPARNKYHYMALPVVSVFPSFTNCRPDSPWEPSWSARAIVTAASLQMTRGENTKLDDKRGEH